mgnify:CR=1 FL=1
MLISLSKRTYTTSLITAQMQKNKAEKNGHRNVRIDEEKADIYGCFKPLTTVYYLRCDNEEDEI